MSAYHLDTDYLAADVPTRRSRLAVITDEALYVHDPEVDAVASGGPCRRYVLVTTEGSPESSYADNPNITMHATPEEMGSAAAGEAEEGWTPKAMHDLDTGRELSWRTRIEVIWREVLHSQCEGCGESVPPGALYCDDCAE